MTLEEAKTKSYPDGGGKYLVDGKYYRVHCDEYHMHSFKCLSIIKDSNEWTLSRQRKPDFDGMYYVYGFEYRECGNIVPFHMIAELRMNEWIKPDVGYQMTYWRPLLDPPEIKSIEDFFYEKLL